MDGFGVMEALKADDADGYLPVIVLTAQPGHKLRALQAGAKDFISKPFDLVEVKTRIHNMLEVRLLYRQLERPQPGARAGRERAHRRTARERGPLPQPDRAGLRLVLGAGRAGEFTKVSGPVLEMLGMRVGPAGGRLGARRRRRLGSRRSGRRCRPTSRSRQPFLDFVLHRIERRRIAAAVPRQRPADVRPGLPIRRLPRHRRGSDGRPG